MFLYVYRDNTKHAIYRIDIYININPKFDWLLMGKFGRLEVRTSFIECAVQVATTMMITMKM